MMLGSGSPVSDQLNSLLVRAGMEELTYDQMIRFEAYLRLILKWNERMNLTSVREPREILSRHFVECIACARALPDTISALLDFGSGAGFPGIPIAICRPDLRVTLAESQAKKAAFLSEAVRVLPVPAKVFAGRAEQISATFDCVTLRAVDRMATAITVAISKLAVPGWLVLMTTKESWERTASDAGVDFTWNEPLPMPDSEQRVTLFGRRAQCSTWNTHTNVPRGTNQQPIETAVSTEFSTGLPETRQ